MIDKILKLNAEGKTVKEIATEMNMKYVNVYNHLYCRDAVINLQKRVGGGVRHGAPVKHGGILFYPNAIGVYRDCKGRTLQRVIYTERYGPVPKGKRVWLTDRNDLTSGVLK